MAAASALRALGMLEHLVEGPVSVSVLARRAGVDKAAVSRTMTALVESGWASRHPDGFVLGPRALPIGELPEHRAHVDRARELTDVVSAVSGMMCVVTVHAGRRQVLVAAALGRAGRAAFADPAASFPLVATASGICKLAQLDDARVLDLVGPDPLPRWTSRTPDRTEVLAAVAACRGGAAAVDRGWTADGTHCVAVPFAGPYGGVGAISLLGFTAIHPDRLAAAESHLRSAAAPGATRATLLAGSRARHQSDGPSADVVDAVRRALRDHHRPSALADNVLAPLEGTVEDRAGVVRRRVAEALEAAFSDTPEDGLLRRVVEVAYLEPDGGHRIGARSLDLSRTSYFRRLAEATERIARGLG